MKTHVSAEVTINARQSQVWDMLSDLESLPQYDPAILKSTIISETRRGVGAERQLDLPDDGHLRERVIDWHEGESYSLEVYEESTPMPLSDQVVHFSLSTTASGQTKVSLVFEYILQEAMAPEADGFAEEAGQLLNHLLAGLKKLIETGEKLSTAQPA